MFDMPPFIFDMSWPDMFAFVFVFAVMLTGAVFWQAVTNNASTTASDKLDINMIFISSPPDYRAETGIIVLPLPADPS